MKRRPPDVDCRDCCARKFLLRGDGVNVGPARDVQALVVHLRVRVLHHQGDLVEHLGRERHAERVLPVIRLAVAVQVACLDVLGEVGDAVLDEEGRGLVEGEEALGVPVGRARSPAVGQLVVVEDVVGDRAIVDAGELQPKQRRRLEDGVRADGP